MYEILRPVKSDYFIHDGRYEFKFGSPTAGVSKDEMQADQSRPDPPHPSRRKDKARLGQWFKVKKERRRGQKARILTVSEHSPAPSRRKKKSSKISHSNSISSIRVQVSSRFRQSIYPYSMKLSIVSETVCRLSFMLRMSDISDISEIVRIDLRS